MPLISTPISADIPLLADIARRALWESHGHSCDHEDMAAYIANRLSDDALLAELLDERNTFRWIHHGSQAAGYSKIILNNPHEFVAAQNVTKMERLYLLETFHGMGLAQHLFDHNLAIARQANQAGIWLYVWKENHRAVAFYQKMGFEIVGDGWFKISERHSNPNHVMFLGLRNFY